MPEFGFSGPVCCGQGTIQFRADLSMVPMRYHSVSKPKSPPTNITFTVIYLSICPVGHKLTGCSSRNFCVARIAPLNDSIWF